MADDKEIISDEVESCSDDENVVAEDTKNTVNCEEEKDSDSKNDAGDEKNGRADKKKVKKLEAELAQKEKLLAAKQNELKELNDKYLRMMAEYDNFRKRSAKEKEGTYSDAYSDAVEMILPILDNLDRAAGFTDAESVQKGVQMTLKGACDAFEKAGIKSFGVAGESFDPNRHNAVMHIDDESLGEGVIVEVFQKGYTKGDKIIRYAMVKVAN